MVDFTETTRTGLMGNMGKSLAMVPIGILVFLGSFLLIWFTSGRADFSKIVAKSTDAPAETAGGQDGAFIAVTGQFAAPGTLGDPEFVAPGEYAKLQRRAEMFAWDEKVETKEKKNAGGSSTKTKSYTYETKWTTDPDDSSEFVRGGDRVNPPMAVQSATFTAPAVTVGAWTLKNTDLSLPPATELSLETAKLVGKGAQAKRVGNLLFMGKGTLDTPEVGDLRIGFSALAEGGRVTAFGEGLGKELVPYLHKGEDRLFRVLNGTRAEATKHLKDEFKTAGMAGYIGGFILMWLGMTMVFAPLHGVMDILPFMGKVSRGLVGCITLPVAMILSAVAITLSVIAHSPIVLALLLLSLVGGGFFLYKQKKAAA